MPLLETGLFSVGQGEQACVAPCMLKLDTRCAYRVAGPLARWKNTTPTTPATDEPVMSFGARALSLSLEPK